MKVSTQIVLYGGGTALALHYGLKTRWAWAILAGAIVGGYVGLVANRAA